MMLTVHHLNCAQHKYFFPNGYFIFHSAHTLFDAQICSFCISIPIHISIPKLHTRVSSTRNRASGTQENYFQEIKVPSLKCKASGSKFIFAQNSLRISHNKKYRGTVCEN